MIAPPADVAAVSSRPAVSALRGAAIAPPPTVQGSMRGSLSAMGDMNIGHSEVVAPAPVLPVEEQRSAAGMTPGLFGQSGGSVVPPPPSIQRPFGNGRGTRYPVQVCRSSLRLLRFKVQAVREEGKPRAGCRATASRLCLHPRRFRGKAILPEADGRIRCPGQICRRYRRLHQCRAPATRAEASGLAPCRVADWKVLLLLEVRVRARATPPRVNPAEVTHQRWRRPIRMVPSH